MTNPKDPKTVDIIKEARPTILGGLDIRVQTGCGNMYIKLNWCHGRLFEVFTALGKSGGCASCYSEGMTRLITSSLRCRMPLDDCIKQLRGLRCPNPVPFPKEHATTSCPDAIANTMIKYGKLSGRQVIELILKANDDGGSSDDSTPPESDDEEARNAQDAIKKLAEKREEDDL